jgi:hypothetical protein
MGGGYILICHLGKLYQQPSSPSLMTVKDRKNGLPLISFVCVFGGVKKSVPIGNHERDYKIDA